MPSFVIPEIAVIIASVILAAAAAKKVKVPMLTHKHAAVALIIVVGFGVWTFDWGGLRTSWEAGAAPTPSVIPGVGVGMTLISE